MLAGWGGADGARCDTSSMRRCCACMQWHCLAEFALLCGTTWKWRSKAPLCRARCRGLCFPAALICRQWAGRAAAALRFHLSPSSRDLCCKTPWVWGCLQVLGTPRSVLQWRSACGLRYSLILNIMAGFLNDFGMVRVAPPFAKQGQAGEDGEMPEADVG